MARDLHKNLFDTKEQRKALYLEAAAISITAAFALFVIHLL